MVERHFTFDVGDACEVRTHQGGRWQPAIYCGKARGGQVMVEAVGELNRDFEHCKGVFTFKKAHHVGNIRPDCTGRKIASDEWLKLWKAHSSDTTGDTKESLLTVADFLFFLGSVGAIPPKEALE